MNETLQGRCLGLIGGLGVGATFHYYRELAKAQEVQGRALELIMAHVQMSRVFEHIQANSPGGLARYLAEFISQMKAGGAQVAAIPAVTPHYCIGELHAISPLPLISILDPVAEEIIARGIGRVAIFGTRFTIESGLFGSLGNVELVTPRPSEVDYIHSTYFEIAQQGRGSEEQHRGLTALAHTLRERDRVDAIVLAGTDLSLLFNHENTDFPHIDCARLHLGAIMRALTADGAR
ncbi:MAG: aspartate/glutamate racemase family protein [Acidobacteriaceae bacterium]